MEDYKPNSNKYKAQQNELVQRKKYEKAVSGTVKVRKKSELRKFADIFIAEDLGTIKSYIIKDVLIPTIKKALSEIIKGGSDMLLYGESKKSSSPGTKISYMGYYKEQNNNPRPVLTRQTYEYEDLIFDSRGDAEAVIQSLQDIIDEYQIARVADLYELAGVTNFVNTANSYGWTNINEAKVVPTRDGYVIKLPKPSAIQ